MPATENLSPNSTPLADCRICGGTGFDAAFGAPCRCQALAALFRRQANTSYVEPAPLPARHSGNGTGSARPVEGPTAKQVAFLTRLAAERPGSGITDVPALVARMTKAQVSGLIDGLLATPAETPAATAAPVRANRYEGTCGRCGTKVAEGAGRIERNDAGRWVTFHLDGECRGPLGPEANATPVVPEGHYAVASRTGNNDLDFFRVDTPTEGRWAGRTFVKRVIGGHPDTPVRGAEARQALEAIATAGPEAAARLYGQHIGRCCRCNRHLTDETSRAAGIGPECAGRVAW